MPAAADPVPAAVSEADRRGAALALQRSALWLTVAVCAVVQFLPPLAADTFGSLWRAAAAAGVLALALALHWLQLARAAWRSHTGALPWLALAVPLAPIGGVAALLLLSLAQPVPAGRGSGAAVQPG